MLTLMLRRTGRVALAAVAAVFGVARLHLFLEGAGLICSFRLACFCLWAVEAETMRWILGAVGCAFGNVGVLAAQLETEVSKDQAV